MTSEAPLRTERELLLVCARTMVREQDRLRLRELVQRDVDWSRLVDQASRQAVTPLLYHHLRNECRDAVPEAVLKQLQRQYEMSVVRNLMLERELIKLSRLFEDKLVPTMSFKGPTLAISAYGNLLLRQFGDLDILLHRADLERGTAILEAYGYRLVLSPSAQQRSLRYHYHFQFQRQDGRGQVELHWSFTPSYWPLPLEESSLWERAAFVTIDGRQVRCLSPEHTLLVLCAHGAKDRWARLQLVSDVAETIRAHPNMNWKWLLAEAARMRRQRILLLGIALAHDLLGTELPAEVANRVAADRAIPGLVDQVRAGDGGPPQRWRKAVFFLSVWNRPGDRRGYLLYILHLLVTPNEHDKNVLPLPNLLRFLYYFHSPHSTSLAISESRAARQCGIGVLLTGQRHFRQADGLQCALLLGVENRSPSEKNHHNSKQCRRDA